MNTINEILQSRFINKNDKPRFWKLIFKYLVLGIISKGSLSYKELINLYNSKNTYIIPLLKYYVISE